MAKQIISFVLVLIFLNIQTLLGQKDSIRKNKRLDFAKMYFEFGSSYSPTFTGKKLSNNSLRSFENPASLNQYLNWGAFHFWGHVEFYVTFPLWNQSLDKNIDPYFDLTHSVVTGARYLPWAFEEKKIRPYAGINWSSTDFQQMSSSEITHTKLSKDFMFLPEAGLMYGYKGFMLRFGINYFYDNKWTYPLSKSTFEEIETPTFNFQLGINYSFENTRSKIPEENEKWNNYPTLSKPNYNTSKFGDFFIGAGPSISFSLAKSEYNQKKLPYLKDQLSSSSYFDIALGYHFIKYNLFTALSFRNPEYVTEGYGDQQTINKLSLTFEINKFLTDYEGFTPYIGFNIAYDQLDYHESVNNVENRQTFRGFEPGITFGWDILPGKTDEVLILRTNLRWYPFSSFSVEGYSFDFSQLEYNLIQLVFYPQRLKKR